MRPQLVSIASNRVRSYARTDGRNVKESTQLYIRFAIFCVCVFYLRFVLHYTFHFW